MLDLRGGHAGLIEGLAHLGGIEGLAEFDDDFGTTLEVDPVVGADQEHAEHAG